MADGQHKLSRPIPPAGMAGRACPEPVPSVVEGLSRRVCPELSRRALLGAALAPALVRHPGLDPGSTLLLPSPQGRWIPDRVGDDGSAGSLAVTIWDRALARLERAEAAIAAVAGAPDHVYDPVGARHHAALARLLRTPAPDLAALARKHVLSAVEGLDLALDERTGEFAGESAAMNAIKRDARRLASGCR